MNAKQISRVYYFKSESKPNNPPYETLEYTNGETSCNCPAWKFRKKVAGDGERTCRHTRLVHAGMGEESAVKVQDYNQKQAQTARTRQVVPKNRAETILSASMAEYVSRKFDITEEAV